MLEKGRFQLTGGSIPSSATDLRALDSPQSNLSGGSTAFMGGTAPQGMIRVDPYASQLVYSHMENLLRQVETQRALLHELLTGVTLTQANAGAPALPPAQRAHSVSADTKRTPVVPDEWSSSAGGPGFVQTLEHLQQLVLSSTREHDKLVRENESLKREVEQLRKGQAAAATRSPMVSKEPEDVSATTVALPLSTTDSAVTPFTTTTLQTPASVSVAPEATPPPAKTTQDDPQEAASAP